MIENQWEIYYDKSGSRALHRFIYQFQLFTGKESQDELLNDFSNEEIEQQVYDFALFQRKLYTESTVMQKVTAISLFYYLHDIPFLSDRIIALFPNYPLYHDDYKIDLIYEK